MPTKVQNPNAGPVTLPWPLRGMLKPGQIVILNLTKQTLVTLLQGGQVPPLDLETVGPQPFYDDSYAGYVLDADPYGMIGLDGSRSNNDGVGGMGWSPEGAIPGHTWEFRAGGGAAVFLRGTAINTAGTLTGKVITDGDVYDRSQLIEYLVTTPATDAFARVQNNNDMAVWRDGWDAWWYFGAPDVSAGHAFGGFLGTAAGATTGVQPSAFVNFFAIAYDATDTNWQVMHNDAAGVATKIDTGLAKPTVARSELYLARARKLPGQLAVQWSIRRKSDRLTSFGVTGVENMPALSTIFRQACIGTNPGATKTAGIGFGSFGCMSS